uniref:Uncharacterized protein n=1 Tax=viral metagenome TaxID=1070528 RepID=A0A6C0H3V8_9ZZZZ
MYTVKLWGLVAQQVERAAFNRVVVGSIPTRFIISNCGHRFEMV